MRALAASNQTGPVMSPTPAPVTLSIATCRKRPTAAPGPSSIAFTWATAGFHTASMSATARSGVLAMAFSTAQWAWVG